MTASHRSRGRNDVTDPLPIRLRVATTDPEVASDRLRQTYAGAEIRTPRDDPAFAYRQDVDGDAELSLGRFHFGGRGRVNLVLEDFAGRVLPFDSAAAVDFAAIFVERRTVRRPISFPDCQIAATARAHDAAIVTRNVSDFEGCGIRVINPWTSPAGN